jgi:hypothetical protein
METTRNRKCSDKASRNDAAMQLTWPNNALMNGFSQLARVGFLGVMAVAIPLAYGGQILVGNSSFSALPGGGLPYGCGTGCSYDVNTPIADWTASGSSENFGLLDPGTGAGNDTWFDSVPEGDTVAYTYGPSLSQTVDTSITAGTVYTLTVDLGAMNGDMFSGGAGLLINGVTYAATGTTPVYGGWSQYTVTYIGLAADVGDNITIQLNGPTDGVDGGNVNFSDVQLTSAAPEPGFMGAVGIVALAFTGWRRRRRGCGAQT